MEFIAHDVNEETLWSQRYIVAAIQEPLVDPLTFLYLCIVRGFYENMNIPTKSVRLLQTRIDGHTFNVTPTWILEGLDISPTPPPPTDLTQCANIPYLFNHVFRYGENNH